MFAKWMKWTFLEAVSKTLTKTLSKLIGQLSVIPAHAFLATFVMGLVQTIGGFMMAKTKRVKIITDAGSIFGACMFGFFATVAGVLGFTVFFLGGDMGVNTFVITLAIVPGALIDVIFFKHSLTPRKWLGVGVAVLAGYSILGWPSLAEVVALPIWVWLSFIMMMSVAINQGITQKIKKIDPFVKNFWGGFTTMVLALAGLLFLGATDLLIEFSRPIPQIWLSSAVIGVIVIGMWSFNLLSYRGGAQIAIKKLVLNGSYLTMAMVVGILLFGETLTVAKIVGVATYLVAFVLMDDNTWQYFRSWTT
jgi:drug/metabolite transporter (DMT)-like permease